ncbi:MAG: pyridoxamine 5'-phosphate oxidase [Kiritimatiellae bacterium]|nr:pyridoxamine 5'-phosphate oxidase [Kiritimatiellia bacterium]
MGQKNFLQLHREYTQETLNEESLLANPFEQFQQWFKSALNAKLIDFNAMTLATADGVGRPSIRTVLLKEYDESGFVFYTNYESRKAKELNENPNGALLFYWPTLERQIKIEGTVKKTSVKKSEAYFQSRPTESQIGAWVSPQSKPIANRQILEEKCNDYKARYNTDKIPAPPAWGGYRLKPTLFEFWQGRPCRLHDRFQYTFTHQEWKIQRLAP